MFERICSVVFAVFCFNATQRLVRREGDDPRRVFRCRSVVFAVHCFAVTERFARKEENDPRRVPAIVSQQRASVPRAMPLRQLVVTAWLPQRSWSLLDLAAY
jgi:hypothetical protein